MRDVIILAVILGAAPLCFFRPYFGVLMWTWIAYFNPHRFGWGIAYNFPVAMLIGGATIAGLPFTKDTNRRLFNTQTVLLLLMWIWFVVTTWHASTDPVLSIHAADSWTELNRVTKILLMTFITIYLVTSKEKLRYLYLVTTFSFGFFALKGAMFGTRTSGEFRVYGPPDSFIADNNAFGLAINMTLPMFYFLARSEQNKWVRRILYACFFAGIPAVLLTYSRGALLGLAVVLSFLAWKSKHRVLAGFASLVLAWAVLTFAPGKWMDRMSNFAHGHLDNSAELRLNAWRYAFELAKHYPLTGGGMKTFIPELYERFTPQLEFAGPHSIYFQTLGEHGFVGLALFLLLLGSSLLGLYFLRKRAQRVAAVSWIVPYSEMLEVSLLAFMISGAFLELANFDFFYQVIATVAILKILMVKEMVLVRQNVSVELSEGELVEAGSPELVR